MEIKINIVCETKCPDGWTGQQSLNVIRVEQEDDGSYTAVTDHWPACDKCRELELEILDLTNALADSKFANETILMIPEHIKKESAHPFPDTSTIVGWECNRCQQPVNFDSGFGECKCVSSPSPWTPKYNTS